MARATLATAIVFAITLLPPLVGDELGGVLVLLVGFVRACALLSTIATAVVWRRLVGERNDEALEVAIDEGTVTVRRGDRTIHESARLVHALAFDDWILLTVETPARVGFAVPVDVHDRARLLAAVPSERRGERRSFLTWWPPTVVGLVALHLTVHVMFVVAAIVLAAAAFAAVIAMAHVGGPAAGAIALVALLAVLAIVSLVRFARWSLTTAGRAALRGVVVALALDVLHAAGWTAWLGAAQPPDAHGEGLGTFWGLFFVGALPGVPWGVFFGMIPLARPTWSRARLVVAAAAPVAALIVLVVVAALHGGEPLPIALRHAALGAPALALAALGGALLAPRPAAG